MSELSDVLGAEPPDGIAALPAAEQTRLVRLITRARDKQARDLDAAFTATVKHVPLPLRGLAKKMLTG